jgi:predicted nucleotidyltransferase
VEANRAANPRVFGSVARGKIPRTLGVAVDVVITGAGRDRVRLEVAWNTIHDDLATFAGAVRAALTGPASSEQ